MIKKLIVSKNNVNKFWILYPVGFRVVISFGLCNPVLTVV